MLFASVHAWWEGGHDLIAHMAEDKLEKEDPVVLKKVNALLRVLETKQSHNKYNKDKPTTLTPREGDHPLMESASWADDLNS